MTTAVNNLLSRLQGVRKIGDRWQAKCPAHEDNRASLSVNVADNGGAVCYCHAGCSTQAVVDAIGLTLRDLMPESDAGTLYNERKKANGGDRKSIYQNGELIGSTVQQVANERRELVTITSCDEPEARKGKDSKAHGKIVAKYDYHDPDGQPAYQKLRYEPKDFRLRKPDGKGGWNWTLNGCPRYLYRLSDVLSAPPDSMIIIVEGEKDADNLAARGLVATTNCGGAGKWRDEYNEHLRGRHVVVLPDHDEAGRNHAKQIYNSLQGIAASVKIVELPGLTEKQDVSDWLDAGHTVDELAALVKKTTDPNVIEYRRITCAELDASNYGLEFLIDRTLVAGQPCIIAGSKKTLKTSLIVDLGISLATAGYFLGKLEVNRAARVAIMSGESGLGTLQETARRVARAAGRELRDIEGLIWSDSLPRFGNPLHVEALRSYLSADEIEVVVIDPAYLCLPTEGNEASLFAMGEMLRSISELCQQIGATLILCHHTRKGLVDPFAPAELEDIAWAGFQEFCRQWMLVSRRQKYEPGSGHHKLWLNLGGSVGHSALWAVDVSEGVYDGQNERYWDVSVMTADEARDGAATDREQIKKAARDAERQAKLETDRKTVVLAMQKMGAPQTQRYIRDVVGFSGARIGATLASLIQTDDVTTIDGKKSGQPVTLFGLNSAGVGQVGQGGWDK